ncbi:MAG: YceI family protein [Rhodocyclales bacterium]|nr:YceI family protein [Rhodocyclales bacterium]
MLAAALGSCAPGVPPEAAAVAIPTIGQPADFPAADYRRAEAAGHRVLRIDPAQSLIAVDVRRDGILARLGHDHVVASHDVHGYVDLDAGRADFYLALAQLVVDEPELRDAAGFSPQPEEAAIAGTRRNMLTRVLDAGRFPFAVIAVRRSEPDATMLQVAITLQGATRHFTVPVQVDTRADGIAVAGTLDFRQTDFGIVPLTALNGALQVADRLDLRFRIVARRG